MAHVYWTEAGPIRITERIAPEYVEQAETSTAASVADPVPLGMAAFGLTIFLFGAIYAWFGTPAAHLRLLMPVAFWFGGVTQFLAAMWAMRKGRTFEATAMGVLSGFWLSWAGITYGGATGAGAGAVLGIYFGLFGVITAYLFMAACRVNLGLAGVLGVVSLAFWTSAVGIGLASAPWLVAAGWCAVITGAIALYTSFAIALGTVSRRQVLPLGDLHPGMLAGDYPSGSVPLNTAAPFQRSRFDAAAGLVGSKGGEVISPQELRSNDERIIVPDRGDQG